MARRADLNEQINLNIMATRAVALYEKEIKRRKMEMPPAETPKFITVQSANDDNFYTRIAGQMGHVVTLSVENNLVHLAEHGQARAALVERFGRTRPSSTT